jgi:hypothetical protein
MTLISGVLAADKSVSLESPKSNAVAITIDTKNWTKLYQSVSNLKIIDSCHREDHTQGYIETAYHLPLVKPTVFVGKTGDNPGPVNGFL